jgi:hypothetical protein
MDYSIMNINTDKISSNRNKAEFEKASKELSKVLKKMNKQGKLNSSFEEEFSKI